AAAEGAVRRRSPGAAWGRLRGTGPLHTPGREGCLRPKGRYRLPALAFACARALAWWWATFVRTSLVLPCRVSGQSLAAVGPAWTRTVYLPTARWAAVRFSGFQRALSEIDCLPFARLPGAGTRSLTCATTLVFLPTLWTSCSRMERVWVGPTSRTATPVAGSVVRFTVLGRTRPRSRDFGAGSTEAEFGSG